MKQGVELDFSGGAGPDGGDLPAGRVELIELSLGGAPIPLHSRCDPPLLSCVRVGSGVDQA